MDNTNYMQYLTTDAWKTKAAARLKIDGYTCQGCGCRGTSENVLQVHHFTYRNIGNENVYTDLVSVCRNCHLRIHNIMNRITDENGRRGWQDVEQVPKIHLYTLSGLDLNRLEEKASDNK